MNRKAAKTSSAGSSLLIRGGHVLDPASQLDALMDVLLENGVVSEIVRPGQIKARATEEFDARGLIVAPGFIDLHVHLREPGQSYKETIASGTAAAAMGGFTSVCCMPNTQPVVDSPELVQWIRHPDRGAVVNVFPIAAATKGSQGNVLTDIRALQSAGAVGVSDDGKPILSASIMSEALSLSAELGIPVIQHAEDTHATENCAMNEGATSFRLGLRGMKSSAESSIVERDIQLTQQTRNARYHVAHLSTADALNSVRTAKRSGVRVTCEVTPHHFTLMDRDVGDYDTNHKMNPPLRSQQDREAMLEGLADGTVDAIATDHAPHAPHEKIMEFERASFGITGLETALGLAIQQLHHARKVPLMRVVELFTAGPARVVDLKGRGSLAAGAPADVTIFDPRMQWRYAVQDSPSKSHNTPFAGWKLTGKVIATIVSGKLVYSGR